MNNRQQQIRIGDYVVEPMAGLVRRIDNGAKNAPQHLQPKVMSVLVYLAERQGDVVAREELIDEVWGRPVTDDVLTRSIYELRSAFDDKLDQPHYIQTIPKIGYRLIAPVIADEMPPAASTGPTSPAVNATEGKPEISSILLLRKGHLILPVVVAAIVVVVFLVYMQRGPRIEFGENDRVVLAAFENFTNDPRLGGALDIAFRTGIEQSPRISILPPVSLVSALERMQKDKDARIDRETAIEISLREQARAVIVASIANVGDSYRLSGEILEPQSGRTVFTHQSTVVDENQILQGLDEVVAAIRQESGEALSAIEDTSVPLERVTTANFEALGAYSIGMQKAGMADLEIAIPFFQEAIRLDSTFAMAFAKLGFLQLVVSDDNPDADWNLEKALEYRDRLTHREQLFVEAMRARNDEPSVLKDAWSLLIYTYPNYAEGYRNLGNVYHRVDNDFEKSAMELGKAVEIPDIWNAVGYHNLGFAQLGLGQYEEALSNFQIAWDASDHPMAAGLGIALIATKNYVEADAFLHANQTFPASNVRQTIEATSAMYFLDQGKLAQAEEMTWQAAATALGDTSAEQRSLVARCAVLEIGNDRESFVTCLTEAIGKESSLLEEGYFKRRYWPASNLALLGKIAARNAMHAEARAIYEAVELRAAGSGYYFIETYAAILEAELMMVDGRYPDAVQILQPLVDKRALFQAHESLARAYDLAGNKDQAIIEYLWLAGARGQAFSEHMSRRFGNEFHVLDWAMSFVHLGRLYEELGAPDKALSAYKSLLEHWSNADDDVPAVGLLNQRVSELSAAKGRI